MKDAHDIQAEAARLTAHNLLTEIIWAEIFAEMKEEKRLAVLRRVTTTVTTRAENRNIARFGPAIDAAVVTAASAEIAELWRRVLSDLIGGA